MEVSGLRLKARLFTPLIMLLPALAALGNPLGTSPPAPKPRVLGYNRDIRPILAESCFSCHGVDSLHRQAGLRLDKPEVAGAKLPSGKTAIVPGSLTASEIIERITAKGPLKMPPASSNKTITSQQIALVKQWVQQGAKYEPQWSYIAPVRVTPPQPVQRAWAVNPIDNFILARLEQEGIHPALDADRRTLIRRLYLDITGLPPSPAEVDAFLRDHDPHAYEHTVDRLLASPHYGERMAVWWLDLVRYADTVGYHGDQEVPMWGYRDYVINSFNSNKPFDTFTREQLAGDLLPNATPEQRLGSGYNKLGMMSAEGGIQDKEYLAKYSADRIRNASLVWMGATLGCAQCHDHKYDPYSQKDFYSFGAFFADLKEHGFYGGGENNDWGPNLHAPNDAQKAELDTIDSTIAATKQQMSAITDSSLAADRARWEADIIARDHAHTLGWTVAKPNTARSSSGSTLTINDDSTVLVSGALPRFDTYAVAIPVGTKPITAIKLEALNDGSLAGDGISRSGTYFVLSEFDVSTFTVDKDVVTSVQVPVASVVVSREDEGFPGVAAIDGRPSTGWAQVYGGGGTRTAVFRLAKPIQPAPNTTLVIGIHHEAKPRLAIGKFRISLTGMDHPDLSDQGLPDAVLAAIKKPEASRTAAETQSIAEFYRTVAPSLEPLRRRLADLQGDRSLLMAEIPVALVSESTDPRTMRVLPRGNWMDDSGEIVQPSVPHFLRQIDRTGRATRLDLANWLVAADNPLTARVLVNRLWKLYFGIGLVKSADDFGQQGEAPINPHLLDWLATELVRSHWDVKHMVRLMLTSHTYRESSDTTPDELARDPFDRLCERQLPLRLDAEMIRDVALDVSGLLSSHIGGPSVRPYEPKGYLSALNFPRREYAPDTGDEQYRRGVYTQWQRSFLHPALLAFDAPTREEGTCTRAVSNTPTQALVLMNDPSFVEAARVFGERIVRSGGTTFNSRLAFAYRTALSRQPDAREAAIIRRLIQQTYDRYATDRPAMMALISNGELPVPADLDPVAVAIWTTVARALLNLHETITRG